MTARVFVAGATGYVGRATVPALRARGAEVIAHVRPGSAREADWRARFGAVGAEVDTTAWEPAAMTATFTARRPTHVYCLIGTTRKRAKGEGLVGDPYLEVDYGLCKLLVDAAVASGAMPRFVLLSSVGVSPTASSKYLHAHWLAEEAVRGSGLAWRIARPSIIGGDGRDEGRTGERVAEVVGNGALAVVGLLAPRMRQRYRSTTPEVLGPALARLGLDDGPDRVAESEALR